MLTLARLDGLDPIESRRAIRMQARLDVANAVTFRQCAERYIAAHEVGWRNTKHAARQEHAAAQAIYITKDTPEAPVDETALVAELENAGAANQEIEQRRANRVRAADRLAELKSRAEQAAEDDRLMLIFTCCHPALPEQARVALTQRTVCGLSDELGEGLAGFIARHQESSDSFSSSGRTRDVGMRSVSQGRGNRPVCRPVDGMLFLPPAGLQDRGSRSLVLSDPVPIVSLDGYVVWREVRSPGSNRVRLDGNARHARVHGMPRE